MNSIERTEVGTPLKLQHHTLLSIEKTSIQHETDGANCWCYFSKQLVALVVELPSGIQAYDMNAGRVTLQDLEHIVPDIESHLSPRN